MLEGRLPDLARFYRTAGGTEPPDRAWPAFAAALEEQAEYLQREVSRPCQTNEVGRSAGLVGAFALLAQSTGLPLRLLEVGASAGLNLRWDAYHYGGGGTSWGPATSPVRLDEAFAVPPPLRGKVRVRERAGCDLDPIDPTTEAGAAILRGFVWPDQPERMRLLEAALAVARQVPVEVERAEAASWLEARLATPRRGMVTVVFHSVFMQYVSEPTRRGISAGIERAGRLASGEAPVAWLRLEPGTTRFEVRLRAWPSGEDRLVAECGSHGQAVNWLV